MMIWHDSLHFLQSEWVSDFPSRTSSTSSSYPLPGLAQDTPSIRKGNVKPREEIVKTQLLLHSSCLSVNTDSDWRNEDICIQIKIWVWQLGAGSSLVSIPITSTFIPFVMRARTYLVGSKIRAELWEQWGKAKAQFPSIMHPLVSNSIKAHSCHYTTATNKQHKTKRAKPLLFLVFSFSHIDSFCTVNTH
jgi:hypothetical protein